MRNKNTKAVALGGILAATAIVIMCMGGLIPVATYVCPMLCAVLQYLVLRFCGKRMAWAWFAAVSLLSLLLGPDKEAAAVFVVLGYYPIVRPSLEKAKLSWMWKLLLFNGAVALLYLLLLRIMGLGDALGEFTEFGVAGLMIMLLLGNVTFFLLDRLLKILDRKKWR